MQDELIVGGLYSVESGDGRFGVVKVLALEPGIVHARLYAGKFESRPVNIDPITLSLGSILDDDFGIGHTPLALEGFMKWQPMLLMRTSVTEEELEGYKIWRDSTRNESKKSFKETMLGIAERVTSIVRPDRPN